jgi:Flp pilus assembly protein TadG
LNDCVARCERGQHSGEDGFYTLLAAICLPLILGAFGLAVDIAHSRWALGQLQNAADAAAFAGSKDLNGTALGRTLANTAAVHYAQQYKVDGTMLASDEVIENVTGKWDFETGQFTETDVSDAAANAIRVSIRRREVPNFVATIFSEAYASQSLTATAVAVAGGTGKIRCAAPLTIGSCVITHEADGTMVCPTALSFQNGKKSIGLTLPDGGSPANGSKAHPFFVDLMDDPDGCGVPSDVGTTLYLQNGNDLRRASVDVINAATDDGVNPISADVAVVDVDCGNDGPNYNQSTEVTGFIRMKIVGARWTGPAPAAVEAACPGLGEKNICVSADCTPIEGPAGGTANVRAEKVFLVR